MTNAKSRILAAVAGALSMGAAAAFAADSQDAKIEQLEAKVAALEAKQAQNSKDLAATIDSVLRDAEKRSQLLATSGDASAGYDNGFFIRAGDAWILRPFATFQFRHVVNYRDNEPEGESDWENGFEVRRMKFGLEGTAFTKELTYKFNWNTSSNSGNLFLEDAYAKYMFADDWGVRLGQYKTLTTHEWLTGDEYQLAVDRSLMDNVIGGTFNGRTQGVSLVYGNYAKNNPLYAELALTDGIQAANSDFVDQTAGLGSFSGEVDFGVTGRVEYKVMGDWKSYKDFSAMGNKEDLLVLGGGFDWSQGTGDIITGTIDGQYETASGFSLYAAGVIQYIESDAFGGVIGDETFTNDSMTNWGVVVQAGYMLSSQWEIFGRYDVMVFDEDVVNDEDTFHEITVGLNYYLGTNGSAGHRAKFTVDVTYLPNGSPVQAKGLGILGNNDAEDEWIVRGQFQLLI